MNKLYFNFFQKLKQKWAKLHFKYIDIKEHLQLVMAKYVANNAIFSQYLYINHVASITIIKNQELIPILTKLTPSYTLQQQNITINEQL